jgi:hypothetical protein
LHLTPIWTGVALRQAAQAASNGRLDTDFDVVSTPILMNGHLDVDFDFNSILAFARIQEQSNPSSSSKRASRLHGDGLAPRPLPLFSEAI